MFQFCSISRTPFHNQYDDERLNLFPRKAQSELLASSTVGKLNPMASWLTKVRVDSVTVKNRSCHIGDHQFVYILEIYRFLTWASSFQSPDGRCNCDYLFDVCCDDCGQAESLSLQSSIVVAESGLVRQGTIQLGVEYSPVFVG